MNQKSQSTTVQIKQIAEQLGLSIGTVSIVLNGRGDQMRISQATQQRILDMAKNLNYQPNIYARRLRKSGNEESPLIIALFWREEFLDDLLGRFLKGLYRTIKENNWKIEVVIQPYTFGQLNHYEYLLNSNHYNGAIIGGISSDDQTYLEQNEFDIPIVLVGRETKKYNSVLIDYCKAGVRCADLFIRRKHQVVGLVGVSKKGKSVQLVEMSFLNHCIDNHIDVSNRSYCVERSIQSGYDAAMKILSNGKVPTAIFIMDGRNTMGVLKACKMVGLKIPNDIEILVFGDNEYFEYLDPTITTIQQPMEEFAKVSLELILQSMIKKETIPRMKEITPYFSFRESCGEILP